MTQTEVTREMVLLLWKGKSGYDREYSHKAKLRK